MNLAKALKTKKRLTQLISTLQMDIQIHNSSPSGKDRKIDVSKLMEDLQRAVKRLIRLKLIIFTASEPMRENILELAELKSRISFLKDIDTHEGLGKENDYTRGRGYVDSEVDYSVEFDIVWVRAEIFSSEEKIDKLQDELDVFNHKTEIEI